MNVTLLRLTTPDAATIADEAIVHAVREAARLRQCLAAFSAQDKRVRRDEAALIAAIDVMVSHDIAFNKAATVETLDEYADLRACNRVNVREVRRRVKHHLATAMNLA